jgi:ribonuclease P protein component
LPQNARLRNSAEFRAVYGKGSRFEGRLVTAFILANGLDRHRLGITASRKMSRHAVDRNRAKRLLREAFRLSLPEFASLRTNYDWVFNVRRAIIETKLDAVIEDLRRVLAQVRRGERQASSESIV